MSPLTGMRVVGGGSLGNQFIHRRGVPFISNGSETVPRHQVSSPASWCSGHRIYSTASWWSGHRIYSTASWCSGHRIYSTAAWCSATTWSRVLHAAAS